MLNLKKALEKLVLLTIETSCLAFVLILDFFSAMSDEDIVPRQKHFQHLNQMQANNFESEIDREIFSMSSTLKNLMKTARNYVHWMEEEEEEGDVTYSKHASFIPRKVKRQPIQLNLSE